MLKYNDSLVGQLTTALVMQTLWGTAPTLQHPQCCPCPSQDFVLRFSELKWNICFKTEIKVGLDFVVVERRWFNNDLLNHSFTNVLQLTFPHHWLLTTHGHPTSTSLCKSHSWYLRFTIFHVLCHKFTKPLNYSDECTDLWLTALGKRKEKESK